MSRPSGCNVRTADKFFGKQCAAWHAANFSLISPMLQPHPESWRDTWRRLLAASLTLLAHPAGAAKAAPTILTYPLTCEGIDYRYDYEWTALRKFGAHPGGFDVQRSAVAMHGAEAHQWVTSARIKLQPLEAQACCDRRVRAARSPQWTPSGGWYPPAAGRRLVGAIKSLLLKFGSAAMAPPTRRARSPQWPAHGDETHQLVAGGAGRYVQQQLQRVALTRLTRSCSIESFF